MLKIALSVLAVMALTAGQALASQCPTLAAQIDAELATATVSDDAKAEIMSLRDQGMEQHEAGQHAESEATLQRALEMLNQ